MVLLPGPWARGFLCRPFGGPQFFSPRLRWLGTQDWTRQRRPQAEKPAPLWHGAVATEVELGKRTEPASESAARHSARGSSAEASPAVL
jgi:hypothetical protein